MLSQKSVPERVATVLFYLSKIYSDHAECTIPLNRTDLADLCGTVKESLVRVLHDLKEENIIDTLDNKGTIRIKNLDLLKRRGEIIEAEYQ
jgi:CRP/FNR family transcriptional regulator